MSLADVRRQIAKTSESAVKSLHASPYVVDQVNTPHLMISLASVDYRMVLDSGKCTRRLTLSIYTPRDISEASQAWLDSVLELDGDRSLMAAIHADPLLQGEDADAVCDYVEFVRATGPEEAAVGTVPYLIVDVEVEVCY